MSQWNQDIFLFLVLLHWWTNLPFTDLCKITYCSSLTLLVPRWLLWLAQNVELRSRTRHLWHCCLVTKGLYEVTHFMRSPTAINTNKWSFLLLGYILTMQIHISSSPWNISHKPGHKIWPMEPKMASSPFLLSKINHLHSWDIAEGYSIFSEHTMLASLASYPIILFLLKPFLVFSDLPFETLHMLCKLRYCLWLFAVITATPGGTSWPTKLEMMEMPRSKIVFLDENCNCTGLLVLYWGEEERKMKTGYRKERDGTGGQCREKSEMKEGSQILCMHPHHPQWIVTKPYQLKPNA